MVFCQEMGLGRPRVPGWGETASGRLGGHSLNRWRGEAGAGRAHGAALLFLLMLLWTDGEGRLLRLRLRLCKSRRSGTTFHRTGRVQEGSGRGQGPACSVGDMGIWGRYGSESAGDAPVCRRFQSCPWDVHPAPTLGSCTPVGQRSGEPVQIPHPTARCGSAVPLGRVPGTCRPQRDTEGPSHRPRTHGPKHHALVRAGSQGEPRLGWGFCGPGYTEEEPERKNPGGPDHSQSPVGGRCDRRNTRPGQQMPGEDGGDWRSRGAWFPPDA